MDIRDEEGEPIPREFLGFQDRHGLHYIQTPSGLILLLGGFAVLLGFFFAFAPRDPEDHSLGLALVIGGLILVVVSFFLYRWQQRRFRERWRKYLEWKQSKKSN